MLARSCDGFTPLCNYVSTVGGIRWRVGAGQRRNSPQRPPDRTAFVSRGSRVLTSRALTQRFVSEGGEGSAFVQDARAQVTVVVSGATRTPRGALSEFEA